MDATTDGQGDGRRATDRPSVRATDDAEARWLSFAELAEIRGISRASASKLVRRNHWRRQTDNQGHVLILVPLEALDRPADRPQDSPVVASEGQATDSPSDAAAFLAALDALREAHAGETAALREEIGGLRERLTDAQAQTYAAQEVARKAQEVAEALRAAEAERRARGAIRRAWEAFRGR